MATDLVVSLEDRPGMLAQVGEALGNAGVNIDGGCGVLAGGTGAVHLLFADPGAARSALEEAGVTVESEREVVTVSIVDQPGELGRFTRRIADAGVNVDLFYLSVTGQLVLGSDDLEGLRRAVS